jgi:hypothetical protein
MDISYKVTGGFSMMQIKIASIGFLMKKGPAKQLGKVNVPVPHCVTFTSTIHQVPESPAQEKLTPLDPGQCCNRQAGNFDS